MKSIYTCIVSYNYSFKYSACAGRIVYHLENTRGFTLRNVKYLVLDEADRLLNLDFEQELNTILKVLPKEDRHTYLFSATMTTKVQKLQRASLNNPVKVEVSTKYVHSFFFPSQRKFGAHAHISTRAHKYAHKHRDTQIRTQAHKYTGT